MPNHVLNQVFAMHKTDKMLWALKGKNPDGEECEVTFHRIIPQPPEVINSPRNLPCGYSGPNWYDFNIKNWGTKWDAYDVDVQGDCVYFNTAWSTPCPVIETLAKAIDDIVCCIYADEDLGNNCGAYYYTPDGRKEDISGDFLFASCFHDGNGFAAAVKDWVEWNEEEE